MREETTDLLLRWAVCVPVCGGEREFLIQIHILSKLRFTPFFLLVRFTYTQRGKATSETLGWFVATNDRGAAARSLTTPPAAGADRPAGH